MKVNIGVSNRHVHLTQKVYNELFGDEITPDFFVHQKNEFASLHFVTLVGPKGKIEHVRVMGPCRDYNQVEIAKSDAILLGICPPVRDSGDLCGACDIIVEYKKQVLLKECCILANTHLHMNLQDLQDLGLKNKAQVQVKVGNERPGIITATVKASENGFLELHIDRDQANAFLLTNGDEVEVLL